MCERRECVPLLRINSDHSLGNVEVMDALTSAAEISVWCCALFLYHSNVFTICLFDILIDVIYNSRISSKDT